MTPIEQLKSVLCDPEGKCCITGSDEDRAIIDRALQAFAAQPAPVPLTDEQMREVLRTCQPDAVELLRSRWLYVKEFARAIEAAHGITEKDQP
jgi:hypothetical protein